MHVQSDQVLADEEYDASLGYAVVSDQASGVGVTAVPLPEDDRGSDLFFVYETIAGSLEFDTAVSSREAGVSKYYDSKAMRKVCVSLYVVH